MSIGSESLSKCGAKTGFLPTAFLVGENGLLYGNEISPAVFSLVFMERIITGTSGSYTCGNSSLHNEVYVKGFVYTLNVWCIADCFLMPYV